MRHTTLGERVQEAIRRSGMAHNEFARAAGLNTSTLSRVKQDDILTAENRSGNTLRAIAAAGNVSLEWLISGEGNPEPVAVGAIAAPARPERYPSKRAAAQALKGLVDEEAIAAMLAEEHSGTDRDPGDEFWFERGLWWNRKRQEARKPALDLLEPPPMVGRPKKGRK